jgi:hypothetical protein
METDANYSHLKINYFRFSAPHQSKLRHDLIFPSTGISQVYRRDHEKIQDMNHSETRNLTSLIISIIWNLELAIIHLKSRLVVALLHLVGRSHVECGPKTGYPE